MDGHVGFRNAPLSLRERRRTEKLDSQVQQNGMAPIDGSIIVNAIPMTLESFFSDQGFVYTI